MKIFCALVIGCLILSGCASSGAIKKGDYHLFSDAITVSPYGGNYKLTGVIEIAGSRNVVVTTAWDCTDRRGEIYFGRMLSNDSIPNVILNGSEQADILFTQICKVGVPIALKIEDSLSPQQKAARKQETDAFIRSLYGR